MLLVVIYLIQREGMLNELENMRPATRNSTNALSLAVLGKKASAPPMTLSDTASVCTAKSLAGVLESFTSASARVALGQRSNGLAWITSSNI